MSERLSSRTLADAQSDEPVIDLTDFNIVLQFAECVRHLSKTRRQSIWSQNVQLYHRVQSETKEPHQIDDILLFLIIIYGKEQYPDEEEQLIAKLKIFITSSPFVALKKYISQKYFPLLRHEFITNNNYFSSMIEDYATTKLSNIPQDNYMNYTKTDSIKTVSTISTIESSLMYSKLEEQMIELFENKFKQLENKINNIEKDVKSIKYAMSEEAKQNMKCNTKVVNIEDIMDEINVIKKQLNKKNMSKKTTKNGNKCTIDKRESIKISVRKRKQSSIKSVKHKGKTSKLKHATKSMNNSNTMSENKKKKKELKKWMKNMQLEKEYFNMFVENGIDSLELVKYVSITDLGLLGINHSAHKVKIMQNIQKLKYEHRISDVETES